MTRHPNVALFEQKTLVLVCNQHPHPHIEFAIVNQQWSLDILLQDKNVGFEDADNLLGHLVVDYSFADNFDACSVVSKQFLELV